MIAFLSGRVIAADTVLVNGVGYAVACAAPLEVGSDVNVWVHTVVRENDISLYGFTSQAERALFVCFMKVSGVGPRVALALLALGAGVVAAAIAAQDAAALSKAAGVGPTKAKTILGALSVPAELLAELAGAQAVVPAPRSGGDDLLSTLVGLGHDKVRSEQALTAARQAEPDAPAPLVLRAALRNLAAGMSPAH